ncbi:MAG: hypothetical protein IT210_24205 [Armatimonadetes bacterium]|nr:hypothetical protein [Armatimonadota bacterium]
MDFTDEQLNEAADGFWEVDTVTAGPVFRVFTHVVIRRRVGIPSFVKASSSDSEQMRKFADYIGEDLKLLSNAEFIKKYKLEPPSPSAGSANATL